MKFTTLLAATAMTSLAMQPASAEELVPYEQFTLDNGLRVIVHEDHATPKVAVSVWYHVGSMNEPEGKSGFAHLFEHLMFNGSEHHDAEYFPSLQEIGASSVNGATSLDQTYYFEVVPTGGLERVLWLEADRMGHLLGAITQAKLDEQRSVVQNEKRTRENQPYGLMHQFKMAGLFPEGHPYHHPVIGSMEDLNDATLEDVKSWFREYYGAANVVVAVSGDVTADEVKRLATKHFGSIPAGPPTSRLTRWVPKLNADKSAVMLDDVPQTAISWNWAVPGRETAETPALKMAAYVLGRGKTSRLYQELVRDRQIATAASASYGSHAIAGVFSINVRLKDGVDRAEAEQAVAAVLREFREQGPTDEELQRSKTSSYADMVRALESIYVKAMALSDGTMFAGDPGDFAEDERQFAATTAEDVLAVSARWLSGPSYRLTVLPYGDHGTVAASADHAQMPALAPSPDLSLPVLKEARLANGIRLQFVRRPGTPIVDLAMVFDAGSAAEQHMKEGIGGFTLGLMDEGTHTLTSEELAEQQAMLGARIYAYDSADTTSVSLSALTRALPESVALWADYIRHPGFRPEDLERDRALTLSALSQSLANPTAIAHHTFSHLLYGEDHAYGVGLDNRAETLKSFTREDVVAFHESWIRPDNAVIYASGDITLEALVATLNEAFGDWQPPARTKGEKSLEPLPAAQSSRVVLVDQPGAIQSVIRVGHLMPSGLDPRDFRIDAMNSVLGGNFTSRLNMNLREDKGWTYGASSFVSGARGPQSFGVATNVQTDKTAEALTEIGREIREYRSSRPATREELDLMIKGEVLALPGRLETNNAVVGYLQYADRFDLPYDYLASLPGKYAALRPELITAAAVETLRPDALTWVVVGDLDKIEQSVRALDLGPVEVWDAEGRKVR